MTSENVRELVVTFDALTIDHLGVKLYSTIPPMIAELVSNAWDADAHHVSLLFDDQNKSIRIGDDGAGMTFDELNSNFLKIGRNRRLENDSDRTLGGRLVLGKKGLGKLSVFGIGKKITVTTVKNGMKNSFTMVYEDIKKSGKNSYKPVILACDEITNESNGTTILIENITRQSDFDLNAIRRGLLSRFKIFSSDFVVEINNKDELKICENIVNDSDWQFSWCFPEDFESEKQDFAGLFDFAIERNIKGVICTAATPVSKGKQGIVLFSRGKLVQESRSFSKRGNDNFFMYMFGQFDVDFVDSSNNVDNCSTDRKSLAWDACENSELDRLNEFMEKVVSISQKKWRVNRRKQKENRVKSLGVDCDLWITTLDAVERPLAQKLVNAILENDDIGDDATATYVSCIKEMYSFAGFKSFTQKLDDLDALGSENAIKLLTDWSEIEAKEYAKISMGRVKAIEQFEKYVKENASENKVIQKFLEEFPWLLDPKMTKFEREVTFSKLLKENFKEEKLEESNRRIDFLCTNDSGLVHVIELKRPNIKLTCEELQQICHYIEFIQTKCPESVRDVKGYLISDNMSYEPGAKVMRDNLAKGNVFVKSYSDLLKDARAYNKNLYEAYEKMTACETSGLGC